MPRKIDKNKLAIRGFETTQRAESGGQPLSNETAADLDMEHGVALLIVSKRSLVKYLHRVEKVLRELPYDVRVLRDTRAMLHEWDTFICRNGLGPRLARPKTPSARAGKRNEHE